MVLTKPGFSLIELVVVVGLLSLLILAISSTMLMSVVSSKRVKTSLFIKQAGNYSLGQLETLLRSAKSIVSCDTGTSTTTFINPDGRSTQIIAELDDRGHTRIASNSGVYLTPENVETSNFTLTCEPSDTNPRIVKISFDLQSTTTVPSPQNPLLHFETSISIRN